MAQDMPLADNIVKLVNIYGESLIHIATIAKMLIKLNMFVKKNIPLCNNETFGLFTVTKPAEDVRVIFCRRRTMGLIAPYEGFVKKNFLGKVIMLSKLELSLTDILDICDFLVLCRPSG